MFPLPSPEICKDNAARLKETWLKTAGVSLERDKLCKTANYFCKCMAFYHLPFIQPKDLFNILSSGNLLSYKQASLQLKSKPSTARTLDIDVVLGLDNYVFLSFAMPPVSTGSRAVIFAFPFTALIEHFQYPDVWVSWHDIVVHIINLFGESYDRLEILEDSDTKQILISEYTRHIFLLEDVPEIAATYATVFYKHYTDAVIKAWRTEHEKFDHRGPEIKIANRLPLSLASYCFVNRESLDIIEALSTNHLLPPNCKLIIDTFFDNEKGRKDFLQSFYNF